MIPDGVLGLQANFDINRAGPEVSGPGQSLLLATVGRPAGQAGGGLDQLRARIPAS